MASKTEIATDGLPKPRFINNHRCYAVLNVGDQMRTTSKVYRSSERAQWLEEFNL
jgi:hypothetical protein